MAILEPQFGRRVNTVTGQPLHCRHPATCAGVPGCPRVECYAAAPVPRNVPGAATVQAKLAQHDEYASAAVRYLIDWLRDDPEPLLAMARGRHAEGHYRYGDTLMFEYSQDELDAEAAQEIADAICYIALKLRRAR